jgi:hypothetical protein
MKPMHQSGSTYHISLQFRCNSVTPRISSYSHACFETALSDNDVNVVRLETPLADSHVLAERAAKLTASQSRDLCFCRFSIL